jgi:N utilization substance protein A
MSQEIIEAVHEIERDKGIEEGALVAALEDALLAAYKKTPGATRHATVEMDADGDFRVFSVELPADIEERLLDEARERKLEELERLEEETGERQHTLISDDDLDIDWSDVPSEDVKREDVTPEGFGRIAAQTAKQVILQRIREEERRMMYDEYIDRVTEVVTGIVQQAGDRNNVLVDLGKVEALLPRSEQVDGERYEQGSRIKAVITEVRSGTKGPQVILSRRDPELIKTLFELEVPEIADGLVEIRGVAREPGYRSKIAVESHAQGVDPVGACVGPRGSRVRMVVSELRGEKIDIIPWNPEPARFVAKALSPASRRPRRPARTRDRQGRHERPARRASHRLEDRHPERHGVRAGGGRGRLRRRRRGCGGLLRSLRRDPRQRQALPEHGVARLPVLRRPGAPGPRGHRQRLRRGCAAGRG